MVVENYLFFDLLRSHFPWGSCQKEDDDDSPKKIQIYFANFDSNIYPVNDYWI